MINFFATHLLGFFDFFHKKKIIKKLKNIINQTIFENVFDVGGHKGETLDLLLKNFEINNIYSFEPSNLSFEILSQKSMLLRKKYSKTNIFLENTAVGETSKNIDFNFLNETSSSTIKSLNINSNYYKKKENFFGKLVNKKIKIKQIEFNEYLSQKDIKKIDLLKIDTEGYEFEVLKGLKEQISNISIILFEHHYDNMIIKNYTFGDIHKLLVNKNFECVFKIKMPFRKSFEYIYVKKLSKKISR